MLSQEDCVICKISLIWDKLEMFWIRKSKAMHGYPILIIIDNWDVFSWLRHVDRQVLLQINLKRMLRYVWFIRRWNQSIWIWFGRCKIMQIFPNWAWLVDLCNLSKIDLHTLSSHRNTSKVLEVASWMACWRP